MGNSGDPALAGAIGAFVDAEQAATRRHAVEALGRLGPEVGGPRLLDRLREEADPAVRISIVRALHGPPTTDAIALMSDRLVDAPAPERSAIISWLGAAARTQPEAQARLAAHAREEGDARLIQQIGAFVPASELR
jgi:HEAT repeat protein